MITWSYGGGVQSCAIAVLVADGLLPKPDLVVMADTGREATETWEYTNTHIKPLFDRLELELHIVPHTLATVDLYGTKGDMLLPAYTTDGAGKLPTFCSVEWKQRVVRRYLRDLGIKQTVMWFGMSLDERYRMRVSDVQWITNHYPLVFDIPKRRHECVLLVERFGLPTPPKSSCWMCPQRKNPQWRRLRDNYPEDWQKAIGIDRQITASHNMYLHESGVPLEQANIEAEEAPEDLFTCESGYCMV